MQQQEQPEEQNGVQRHTHKDIIQPLQRKQKQTKIYLSRSRISLSRSRHLAHSLRGFLFLWASPAPSGSTNGVSCEYFFYINNKKMLKNLL